MSAVDTLLLRSEGDTLDFKRDSYPFVGATDEQKAELLKDVLAMANTFKESDAYILSGVAEENGRATEIVGVSKTLTDHDAHQFINSKTNRPIKFAVDHVEQEGKLLTLIRVNRTQDRPLFLKQSYGGLRKNVVYIRHGSSTAEASPDEISQMGRVDQPSQQPDISLIFEVVLETWKSTNMMSIPMLEAKEAIEVDLLKVAASNEGTALAQYVQGSFTVPRGLLWDYVSHHDLQESFNNPELSRPITIKVRNQLRDPPPHYLAPAGQLEWKPLSPGMRLVLTRERMPPFRQRLKEMTSKIQWQLAVDSRPLKTGEQALSDLPIVDRRTT